MLSNNDNDNNNNNNKNNNLPIYLSIYKVVIPLKVGSQDKTLRVQSDFTLPFPSVLCLFIGENKEKWLPRPLAQSLLVAFFYLLGIQ